MARTLFFVALLCAAAVVKAEQPTNKVDPVENAAAGAVGAAVGPVGAALTGGFLKPETVSTVSANALLAVDSAKDAHTAATKLVGGLLSKTLDVHKNAGTILVEIVSAINSLNLAGINLAAGVTNSALTALVGKIRGEALAIGNIYTELLGEFGRFVGGTINAVQTLKRGVFVSPLALGVNHLEKTLQSLITFLEAAVSPSVAGPNTAAKFLPHLTTLKAVKALLGALDKAIKGPGGAVVDALDGATSAANAVLGAATGATGDVGKLISQGLQLISQIPGL